eukprot:514597-Prorocentrum_minimum.AAC.3
MNLPLWSIDPPFCFATTADLVASAGRAPYPRTAIRLFFSRWRRGSPACTPTETRYFFIFAFFIGTRRVAPSNGYTRRGGVHEKRRESQRIKGLIGARSPKNERRAEHLQAATLRRHLQGLSLEKWLFNKKDEPDEKMPVMLPDFVQGDGTAEVRPHLRPPLHPSEAAYSARPDSLPCPVANVRARLVSVQMSGAASRGLQLADPRRVLSPARRPRIGWEWEYTRGIRIRVGRFALAGPGVWRRDSAEI